MLSDVVLRDGDGVYLGTGLNALSSIVCFLTRYIEHLEGQIDYWSLNALSSIVCFLTKQASRVLNAVLELSQCPLEHCMLSDNLQKNLWKRHIINSLNALSSIVCFLTASAS